MNPLGRSGLLLAILALAACGGGGGGGGGGAAPVANTPGFAVSPSSLTVDAASTTDTVLARVLTGTVSGPVPETLYLNIQVVGQAVANIGTVTIRSPNSATASVTFVAPQTLGPGTYSSVITVTACTTSVACTSGVIGQPQTINVTYNVTGVRSSVPGLVYSIVDKPTAADLTKTFAVTGYPAQAWTIVSNASWLTVSPPNGNAGASTTVTASLRAADADTIPSGTYSGSMTLTPTTGDPLQLPVTLNVSRAYVNFVAPYVDLANTQRSVIIRGDNLTRSAIQDVRFGNHSATSFTVIDGTEIRATHPALPAGTYPVSLVAAESTPSRASLLLVDPLTYASAVIDYPQAAGTPSPLCLIHDPERDALLVGLRYNDAGASSTRLIRYKRTPTWSVDADVAIANLSNCAATIDGTRVLVTHLANGVGAQPLTVPK